MAAGKNYNNCSSICKACDFLLSKQLASGGWGESYLSCQNKVKSVFIFFLILFFYNMKLTFLSSQENA